MLCMGMSQAPADMPDDPAALKEIIAGLQATLRAHDLLVQALRIRIAKLQKQKFVSGRPSPVLFDKACQPR